MAALAAAVLAFRKRPSGPRNGPGPGNRLSSSGDQPPMKIALDATGKIGSRAARVLLAERSVEALGLIGRRSTSGDPRVSTITNLAGWDVLAIDDPEQLDLRYRQASDHGIPLVCPPTRLSVPCRTRHSGRRRVPTSRLGLAACLAADDVRPLRKSTGSRGRVDRNRKPVATWPTADVSSTRREPVGPRRTERLAGGATGTLFLAAPFEGPWTGLVARVTAATPEGVEVRTIGVADDSLFLAGIALAAAALAAGTGAFPIGRALPNGGLPAYLDIALRAGLDGCHLRGATVGELAESSRAECLTTAERSGALRAVGPRNRLHPVSVSDTSSVGRSTCGGRDRGRRWGRRLPATGNPDPRLNGLRSVERLLEDDHLDATHDVGDEVVHQAARVVSPVISTVHTTPRNTATRRYRSPSANNSASASSSVIFLPNSSIA